MAETPRSLELFLQCQVCFEDFEDDGAHVPRLLSCTHTLCHTCIGRLVQEGMIECPECRKKHEARKDEKSFAQNKNILTQIKRKSSQKQPKAHEVQKCVDHGKELSNLFCLNPECNKPICRTCLRKDRRGHNVTEIEDQEKEALMKDVMAIKMNLEAKVKIMSTAKNNITEKTNAVVADLKKTKKEIDKMIEEIEDNNKRGDIHIYDEISAMNSNIELLNSIQQSIEDEEDPTYEGIMNHRDTVAGVSEHNTENLSGMRSFRYPVLNKSPVDVILGTLNREEFSITLQEPEHLSHEKIRKIPTITNASQLKCSGSLFCLGEILFSLERFINKY